jgi:hypothetical protein
MLDKTKKGLAKDLDDFFRMFYPIKIWVTVSDYVKPISQCRLERACIKQGEPLGGGKGNGGGGGVSIQPTWDQRGREFAPRHKGGISK